MRLKTAAPARDSALSSMAIARLSPDFSTFFVVVTILLPESVRTTKECCTVSMADLVHTLRPTVSSLTSRARYLGVRTAWKPTCRESTEAAETPGQATVLQRLSFWDKDLAPALLL